MSYIALYRKFRPDSFDEVKGQDHIVTTLKNQIKHDRVGHAYLFCGTRGTGKTTMAKLLAKTVNCDNPTENGPCGQCPSCRAIADGSALNIREIDAASNSGVDNIRNINESVRYSPAQGKYLVYIIDEVHMLSSGAYNALLKTLEEPPEYVIFILATTDEHKIPVTIKSRCQRYDFHRISLETITDRLEYIVNREGGKASRDALKFIARTADGSMRDALSILDECMSASVDSELSRDKVLSVIGAVSVDIYIEMLEAMRKDDANRVLELINETIYGGKDLVKFVDDFTWFMRNVFFLKLSPGLRSELDMSEETADELIALGEGYSNETLTRYLNILQELCSAIRMSSVKRVTLEMAIIRMMRPETDMDLTSVISRLDRLEAADETLITEIINKEIDRRIRSGEIGKAAAAKQGGAAGGSAAEENISEEDMEKLQSQTIIKNIRDSFEPATAEELEELSKRLRTDIPGKLEQPGSIYIRQVDIEPSPDYGDGGEARLRIVFDARDTDNPRYIYFSREEHRTSLAEQLSDIIKKKVNIDIVTRKGASGRHDKNSQNLNKINFEIDYKEEE